MFGIKLLAATVMGWVMALGVAGVLTCLLGLPEPLATPLAAVCGLAVMFSVIDSTLDRADEEFE